ncbi:hypothetical protein OS493_020526 [Desmophyllum pertusum]|uniref:Glyoxalase/fosfomycin resistance/dioxygenase domain-containing protein n=1 Tax=Desmophyllum pertusum TaxID=174260 RepID=A0A9X0CQV4_9CNID|nr:hypothetical protein OS493_020526 [Desmophyllum pertusum]
MDDTAQKGKSSKSQESVEHCKQFSISHIDHIVLTVESIESTLKFYNRVLGMDEITFGQGRKALSFGIRNSTCIREGKSLNQKLQIQHQGLLTFAL